jgi:hypothetical protein
MAGGLAAPVAVQRVVDFGVCTGLVRARTVHSGEHYIAVMEIHREFIDAS